MFRINNLRIVYDIVSILIDIFNLYCITFNDIVYYDSTSISELCSTLDNTPNVTV